MSATIATKSDVVKYRARWTQDGEVQRRHRLLRALHELLDSPAYTLAATVSADGQRTIRIAPPDVITDEARTFAREHKADLHEAVLDLHRQQRIDRLEEKLSGQFDAFADPEVLADDAKFAVYQRTLSEYRAECDGDQPQQASEAA